MNTGFEHSANQWTGIMASGRGNVLAVRTLAEELFDLSLPLIESPRFQAGFPSPAGDYVEEPLDLNKYLVANPTSTFFAVVSGDSMVDARIFHKDIVSVDRSKTPVLGSIVVAVGDGDFFIKCLARVNGRLALVSKNDAEKDQYRTWFVDEFQVFEIWGVVTSCVRKF